MSSTEDIAVAALRGTVDASHRWPDGDSWAAMAAWRQERVGAVLVGRRTADGDVFYDVVACQHDGDDWHALVGGGSVVHPASIPRAGPEEVCWFFSQDVAFTQENGEEAYVSTFVGVAAPGTELLTLRFSNGSRMEINVPSGDRLVLVGAIQQADEELSVQVS